MATKISKLYEENNILVMVILLLSAYIIYNYVYNKMKCHDENEEDEEKKRAKSKYIMYGVDSCGWTVKQKKELGDDMNRVVYVNCENEEEMCAQKNITGYPSWEINGVMSSGFKTKKEVFG